MHNSHYHTINRRVHTARYTPVSPQVRRRFSSPRASTVFRSIVQHLISHIMTRLPAGQAPVLLSAGIHSFPFKLGLPLGLPSTFLGKHGWVQFFCKAAIKESGGLVHKNQQVFIVMNPIDLNVEPPVLAVSVGRGLVELLGRGCSSGVFCCLCVLFSPVTLVIVTSCNPHGACKGRCES